MKFQILCHQVMILETSEVSAYIETPGGFENPYFQRSQELGCKNLVFLESKILKFSSI